MCADCSGARMRPERAENRVQTPNGYRHSDKEKFCNDLNGPKTPRMSERLLKTLQFFGAFQAEYEGSIPFTRSKQFQRLGRNSRSRSDSR
jgi:hypothetical protein